MPVMWVLWRSWLTICALLALAGCSGCGSDGGGADAGPRPQPGAADSERPVISLIDQLPSCDIDHRGLLLDLGGPELAGRLSYDPEPSANIVRSEHDGATWARIYERKLTLTFLQPEVAPLFVALRAVGRDSSRVHVYLDGYLLGSLKLAHKEIRTVSTRVSSLPVDAGLHTLQLRFGGRKRAEADPYGEIDWIRIGTPDELQRTYGAPTFSDLLAPEAELGGVPHRAIGMRAPGTIRCAIRVPPHGRLRTSIGMRGSGSGSATISVWRDGGDVEVLERVDVKGSEAVWRDVEVSLHEFAREIVTLELAVTSTTGTGRLLFGDPLLSVPQVALPTTAKARAAIVVMLDGVQRSDLPPWRDTETPHLPTLNQLARSGAVFDNHRAASTLVATAAASIVSGLSPREHALADSGARLPKSVPTIGKVARDASVRAGMFTGVPLTFETFGFASGWDKFEQYPPQGGSAASAPFDDVATFLTDDSDKSDDAPRMLALLHARGGHPPWDITPPEAAKLPPAEYAGYLGPRRAAQFLANLDGRQSRISEGDRERMRALYFAGLSGQDHALGELIRKLQDAGRWESTLLIVTGTVASARQSLFRDGLDLDEGLLEVPLYVHFPGGAPAGARSEHPTESYDVTRTALVALGLEPPAEMRGRDLASVAGGISLDTQLVRVAILDDQYSARWGDFVLKGRGGKRPRLCHFLVDPTCASDRTHRHPMVAQALFRRVAATALLTAKQQRPAREPLIMDTDTAATLKVWGAQ
jgi:arylsulfatase A-like enzyme